MKKNINRRTHEKKQSEAALSFLKEPRTRFIIGLAFILFSLYLLFSFIGFFFTGGIDQSLIDKGLRQIVSNPEITAANPAGNLGAWCSDLLINRWFGISSFIFCYILILSGIRIAGKEITGYPEKNFFQYRIDHLVFGVFGLYFRFVLFCVRPTKILSLSGRSTWIFCHSVAEFPYRRNRDLFPAFTDFCHHPVFRIRKSFL